MPLEARNTRCNRPNDCEDNDDDVSILLYGSYRGCRLSYITNIRTLNLIHMIKTVDQCQNCSSLFLVSCS